MADEQEKVRCDVTEIESETIREFIEKHCQEVLDIGFLLSKQTGLAQESHAKLRDLFDADGSVEAEFKFAYDDLKPADMPPHRPIPRTYKNELGYDTDHFNTAPSKKNISSLLNVSYRIGEDAGGYESDMPDFGFIIMQGRQSQIFQKEIVDDILAAAEYIHSGTGILPLTIIGPFIVELKNLKDNWEVTKPARDRLKELYDLWNDMLLRAKQDNFSDKMPFIPAIFVAATGSIGKEIADEHQNIVDVAKGNIPIPIFQKLEYKDQCILLNQIFNLAGLYKEKLGLSKSLAYSPRAWARASKNASLIVDGHPFGFINKLTQYPGNKEFFEMKNHEISNLQPLIRFFKVIGANKASDKIDKEIEISFDSYAKKDDIEDIFKPLPKRGFGVGIKNFSLTYDGNNPFAAKKSIKATLSIFANNFGELLKVREGRVVAPRTDESPRREKYRYIDLALKTGKSVAEKNPDLNELDFRLKAVFGYTPIESTLLRDGVRKALKNNFVSINLTPVTHNFEFDEMGRVTFNIEFFAFVEEFYDKPRMNIFADKEIYLQILKRKLAFETLQKKDCDSAELVSKIKEAEAETINEEKKESLQFLMRQLSNKGKIYYLNLESEQLRKIAAKGPHYNLFGAPDFKVSSAGAWGSSGPPPMTETLNSNIEKAYESALEDEEDKEHFMQSFRISGIDSVQIPFFYVGDLLDIIIGGVEKFLSDASGDLREKNLVYDSNFENKPLHIDPELAKIEADNFARSAEQFKKFRLLLGPLEIVNHKKLSKSANINFADLPIAVSYFMEWLTTKTLALSSAVYPLTQFLNDLFNDLIRNYLNDDTCYAFNIKQKVRLNQAVITSYKKGNTDEITEAIGKGVRLNLSQAGLPQPLLNISGHHSLDIGLPNPGMDKETNYFIFFAGRAQPQDLMEGIKSKDESRGIFHYILGRDIGIVKNISLTKTNAPGLKEVRFEQEGYEGLTQLREIYDVNVDCFANVQAFPGTYIFVDPRGFSPSLGAYDLKKFDITDLGIGGYYMIITSEHNFGPGQANTTLRAKWVAALEKEDDEQMAESGVGSNDEMPKKCSIQQDSATVSIDVVQSALLEKEDDIGVSETSTLGD